jgi:hypothetical protein
MDRASHRRPPGPGTRPTRRQSIAVRPLSGPRLTRPVHAVTVAGRRSPPAAAMLGVLSRGG